MVVTLEEDTNNNNSNMKVKGGALLPGWVTGRPCDTCRIAAALLYCTSDATFLCGGCDAKIHGSSGLHERIWVCEVCEQAPAVVTCRADAAALCSSCDHDIHSANPLARRHHRVPVVPFLHSAVAAAAAASSFFAADEDQQLILNPSSAFLFEDSDVLDFGYGCQNQSKGLNHQDSVVPTQSKGNLDLCFGDGAGSLFENCFDIDFSQPDKHQKKNHNCNDHHQLFSAFNFSTQHSVSSSDIGVVPDGNANSMSEVSFTMAKSVSSTVTGDGGSSAATGAPSPGLDREARVLRYREKRKNRKFEKTIRYASRKAYAEKRPRIKGRFAKRTEMNETSEIDPIYGPGSGPGLESRSGSMGLVVDHGYGVVPTF